MKFAYLRWMVRSAMLFIVAGALTGLLMQLAYRIPQLAWAHALRSSHIHMLLVGGVIQMIVGVALWMFPRRTEQPQWPTGAQGWTLYALLSGGTLLRALAAPFQLESTAAFVLATAGATMQVAAIVMFIALAYHRARGPRLDAERPQGKGEP